MPSDGEDVFLEGLEMNSDEIEGCCAAQLLYNIGTAHDIESSKNQEEFDEKVRLQGTRPLNICILNSEQKKEAKFLRHQGWKFKKVGELKVGTIEGKVLKGYFFSLDKEKILSGSFKKAKLSANLIQALYLLCFEKPFANFHQSFGKLEVKKYVEFIKEKTDIDLSSDVRIQKHIKENEFSALILSYHFIKEVYDGIQSGRVQKENLRVSTKTRSRN